MKSSANLHTVIPFPKNRRLVTDIGRLAKNRHTIQGLVEIDITKPRRIIQNHKEETGETLSFSAFLTYCVGRAVDNDKILHAYRNWIGKLIVFDEVDITMMIEVEKDGKKFPVGHIVRNVNNKTFRAIHNEIRAFQTKPMKDKGVENINTLTTLPGFIRRLLLRAMDQNPHCIKRHKGTVILTAVGMFGKGGGWGISLPTHTLGITVGGITKKPGIIEDRIEPREYLNVTLGFDHDIVDGAPAARFTQRFRELVENGSGLVEYDR
jgi:pyruvate/2-oxoglutarate dehydrogenase complex dihydrolipoamide acyltransferase (E2) component